MVRLFVGLALPAEVRRHLALMAGGLPGARWTREDSYHLTLRFIGEVDQGLADDIDGMLGHLSAEAFELTLSGVGFFGKAKAARALWAGVTPSAALLRLQSKIEAGLQRMSLPAEERKYTPHVTLARLRGAPAGRLEAYVADHSRFTAGPFPVREFTLFSSFLSSSGAIHTPEATYALD